MRTIYHTLIAALFLIPVVGCNHTAGFCDCDQINDPCQYCPKPYPAAGAGGGAGLGCGCQAGAPEHLAPVADAVVK
jgi:hypothetical protein